MLRKLNTLYTKSKYYIELLKGKSPFNKTLITRTTKIVNEFSVSHWFIKTPINRDYHMGAMKFIIFSMV